MRLRNLILVALSVCSTAHAQDFAHDSVDVVRRLAIPEGAKKDIVPGQIRVKFRESQARAIESNVAARTFVAEGLLGGAQFRSRLGQSGWTLWTLPQKVDTVALSQQLMLDRNVAYAEPVFRIYPLIPTPNDPDYNYMETSEDLILVLGEEDPIPFRRLWYLDDTFAESAWTRWPNQWYTAANKPSNTPTIAIIDTGCDMTHPDFINAGGSTTNITGGGQIDWAHSAHFEFGEINTNSTPNETHGHGTHVTGLAVAAGNNGGFMGNGMIGLGFNAKAMILRVFNDVGEGTDTDAASAIYYAADNGVDIINLSIGTESFSQAFQDAVTYAFEKGSLVIAAGNEDGAGGGDLGPIYPAACSGVIGVTANGPDFYPATGTYSGTGYYADISAPGGDLTFDGNQYNVQFIWSTAMTQPGTLHANQSLYPPYTLNYAYLAGTSMATPMVSGTAALYYGRFGLRQGNWANVRGSRALQIGASNVLGTANGGWNYTQGYGILNADATVAGAPGRSASVGSIEGIVYINSIATANVPVRAKKGTVTYTTTTHLDGTYKFDALPAGTYDVYIPGAGAGLPATHKNALVKVGCDVPNCNFWAKGTFNFDETAPVAAVLTAVNSATGVVSGKHWAYDTETGIDKMTMKIGTTPGAADVMAETEVFIGGDTTTVDPSTYRFTGLTLNKKRKYYLRATYLNGAQLTTVRDVAFGGPRTTGPHP